MSQLSFEALLKSTDRSLPDSESQEMKYTKTIRYRTIYPDKQYAEEKIRELLTRHSYLGGRIYDIHGREAEGWVVEAYFACPEELDENRTLPEQCSLVYVPAFMYDELGWSEDGPEPPKRGSSKGAKGGLRAL